jgi:threonine/homoserine/homoserine lactone efflux protein
MGEMLAPLVLFALVLCLTPGPNVVMVTASAANFGFRRAIPQMLGITLGFGVMVLAVGLGLAGVFHAEPRLHILLKYGGAAYLLHLAWRIAHADAASSDATRARPINFVEAVLFTWINPKGWVTAVGALAAYTTVGGDAVLQTCVIAAVLAAACLASGGVRRGDRALPRQSARPRKLLLVDGGPSGALSHPGVLVTAERE